MAYEDAAPEAEDVGELDDADGDGEGAEEALAEDRLDGGEVDGEVLARLGHEQVEGELDGRGARVAEAGGGGVLEGLRRLLLRVEHDAVRPRRHAEDDRRQQHLRDVGEMRGRCGGDVGDVGEMWARCGGDVGEM